MSDAPSPVLNLTFVTFHVRVLRVVAAVAVAGLGGAGCFEEGPLLVTLDDGATTQTDTGLTVTDTGEADSQADATGVPDTATDSVVTQPPGDTEADSTSDAPDAADAADSAPDDTAQDTVEPPPCLTVGDCPGGSGPADRCAGTVDCIDYKCVADPSTVVVCDPAADACQRNTCDPSTGMCVTSTVCQCAPTATLACATPLNFSTDDTAGTTNVTDNYSCVFADNTGPERTFAFQPATPGRVRLSLLNSGGMDGFRVVPVDGSGDCQPTQCLAESGALALFDAAPGVAYAVMVEETASGHSGTLTAECGITEETRCSDALDDDGDGATDCDDVDCDTIEPCIRPPDDEIGLCFDEIDNDEDSRTDCGDTDCHSEPACLQGCQVSPTSVLCGFSQGASTGGGKIRATDYSCGPAAPGKEIVYRFVPTTTQSMTVTLSSGIGHGLYILEDRGSGCTPLHCIDYSASGVTFLAQQGMTYFFAVDGPEGVSGAFQITVTCN